MSQNHTIKNWPLGWTPSSDDVNGNPQGLLRMDNLQQEEDGCLTLVRGFSELGSSFSDFVSDIYSKVINGTEKIWVGLNLGREIFRVNLDFSGKVTLSSGGGTRPAFGDGLGQVIACSGNQRKKDDGTTIRDLGITSQLTAPVVDSISQAQVDFFNSGGGSWAVEEGSFIANSGTEVQFQVDSTSLRGSASVTFTNPVDTTNTGDGPADDPNQDTFYFFVQLSDSSIFTKVRVELYMDPDNYYWFEWPTAGSVAYTLGIDTGSTLSCKRGEFTRQGSDQTLNWTKITKQRVVTETISLPGAFGFLTGELRFLGGAAGQLNGLYTYIQVDVYDNGIYIAKSAPSPASPPAWILNGRANVALQPSSDTQVTASWLFRKSVPTTTIVENINTNGQNVGISLPTGLTQYYRVGTGTPGSTIVDTTSDVDAIEQNITLNPFLISIKDLVDPIIGMEGIYNERMLYLTPSMILLSDRLNIDAYDPRFSIKAFGDPTEANLWLKKINNNTLILATTKDLYSISGTLLDLPDGSLDVNIQPIGEAYPPLSQDVAASDGAIFYAASQGWRFTTGSNSLPIDVALQGAGRLSLLFQGFPRFGVPSFVSNPGNTTRYAVAVGRGKFYAIAQCSDGTRRLLIYDLKRQTWRLQNTDPIVIHVTLSDRVLLGYGLGSGNFVQEMEVGIDGTKDGTDGQSFFMQTVFDDFGNPRNRKDLFTLKIVADSQGVPFQVKLAKDKGVFQTLSDVTGTSTPAPNGLTTLYFDLNNYGLGFRYALNVLSADLDFFKLYEATFEYELRPEQNVFQRIINDNFGTYSRKRYTAYAIIIDTLGQNVTLTPIVDDVAQSPLTINTTTKDVVIYYFTTETVGTVIGATLESVHPFEFWGVDLQQTVSETMPTPCEYLVIPQNDYGSPNRKRHTSYKFQINTRGANVVFTPKVDGVNYASAIFNTTIKQTVDYYFDTSIDDVIGVDIGGVLDSNGSGVPFEFYGVIVPQQVEEFPPLLRSFVIPSTNYGSPGRKRFTSFKFQINTFGFDVKFQPKIDDTYFDTFVVNTAHRQIVEVFLNENFGDITGIDIGGRLQSLTSNPFEYYGNIVPQEIENLPPRLTSLLLSANNFGVPARKRIRTIPFQIDTHGQNVQIIVTIDGVALPAQNFLSVSKKTLFYYFQTDVFGIDYSFSIQSNPAISEDSSSATSLVPFEFFGFVEPLDVEVLPVGRVYDQLGPVRFDKIGKMFNFRVRLVSFDATIPYTIFSNEASVPTYSAQSDTTGVIACHIGVDDIYEVQLPKSINGTVFRIVLGPTVNPFHRYDCQIKVAESGMETESTWVPVR